MNDMQYDPEQAEVGAHLRSIVAAAYRLFGRYAVPTLPLDACQSCCMAPEREKEMRKLPLHELTAQHLYEYNTAAGSEVQPAHEVMYLLPRMLELLAEGAEIHHSIELSLARLGRCAPGDLGAAERRLLERFALAPLRAGDRRPLP